MLISPSSTLHFWSLPVQYSCRNYCSCTSSLDITSYYFNDLLYYCSLWCSRSDSPLWVLLLVDQWRSCNAGLYMYIMHQRVASSPPVVELFAWVVLTMCLSLFLWLLHTYPLHPFHYLMCLMVWTCLYILCITLLWTTPSSQKLTF